MNEFDSLTKCKPGKNKSDSNQMSFCLKEIPSTTVGPAAERGSALTFGTLLSSQGAGAHHPLQLFAGRFSGQPLHYTRRGLACQPSPGSRPKLLGLFRLVAAWIGSCVFRATDAKSSRGDSGGRKVGVGERDRSAPLTRDSGPGRPAGRTHLAQVHPGPPTRRSSACPGAAASSVHAGRHRFQSTASASVTRSLLT